MRVYVETKAEYLQVEYMKFPRFFLRTKYGFVHKNGLSEQYIDLFASSDFFKT